MSASGGGGGDTFGLVEPQWVLKIDAGGAINMYEGSVENLVFPCQLKMKQSCN